MTELPTVLNELPEDLRQLAPRNERTKRKSSLAKIVPRKAHKKASVSVLWTSPIALHTN
jgi:hypothetical protein